MHDSTSVPMVTLSLYEMLQGSGIMVLLGRKWGGAILLHGAACSVFGIILIAA